MRAAYGVKSEEGACCSNPGPKNGDRERRMRMELLYEGRVCEEDCTKPSQKHDSEATQLQVLACGGQQRNGIRLSHFLVQSNYNWWSSMT